MRIDSLYLEGFRNYDEQSLAFDPDCNVIYGENAQGKTNLLEAMVYLSCGKSPYARSDRDLIGFQRQCSRLEGHIRSRDRDFVTAVELNRGQRRGGKERSGSFLGAAYGAVCSGGPFADPQRSG